MGKRRRVLLAPDPRLLLELFPEELFHKITQIKICVVVDVDGTYTDSDPMYLAWLSEKLRRSIKSHTRYDFRDIDLAARGMLLASVFSNARMHADLPLIAGAKQALKKIRGMGVPIVILTARPTSRSMVRVTEEHAKKNGIPFDLMIFSRHKKEIIQAIKREMGCHVVVVDDDPNVAQGVGGLVNVTTLLFSASYNEFLKSSKIKRVKDKPGETAWEEVLKIIRRQVRNGRS